jgi:hypothetical protein
VKRLLGTTLLGAAFWFAGCTGSGENDANGPILLHDENNYRTTSSLALPIVATAPAADLDICWTDVATDIQCHAVVPQTDLERGTSQIGASHGGPSAGEVDLGPAPAT